MEIDPAVEAPARKLFGFAIRAELDQFERTLTEVDPTLLGEAVQLATVIAGAVVLEVTGGTQPSDADLRKLAETAAKAEKRYEIAESDVHTYLSRCVFGGENLDELFPPGGALVLPFIITGNLLGSYTHLDQGQDWWEYLDALENAVESAP